MEERTKWKAALCYLFGSKRVYERAPISKTEIALELSKVTIILAVIALVVWLFFSAIIWDGWIVPLWGNPSLAIYLLSVGFVVFLMAKLGSATRSYAIWNAAPKARHS